MIHATIGSQRVCFMESFCNSSCFICISAVASGEDVRQHFIGYKCATLRCAALVCKLSTVMEPEGRTSLLPKPAIRQEPESVSSISHVQNSVAFTLSLSYLDSRVRHIPSGFPATISFLLYVSHVATHANLFDVTVQNNTR